MTNPLGTPLKSFSFVMFCYWGLLQTAAANDFTEHADYSAFIDTATQAGLDQAYVDTIMQKAKYKESIINVMGRPGERKDWYEYYPTLINEARIAKGVRFAKQYRNTLQQAEKDYGVSQAVILGILGIETIYGGNKGNFRVIDALATLAFFGERRRDYFASELVAFFKLSQLYDTNPLSQKSSYAGAIGYAQFMPSSILKYGVDYNNDGVIDLNNSPVDAIGSIANYLAKHGWQKDQPIAVPATYNGTDDTAIVSTDLTRPKTLAWLAQQGLSPTIDLHLAPLTPTNGIRHITEDGPAYWITFNNFQVITTYNKSRLYATAVWKLGEAVENEF